MVKPKSKTDCNIYFTSLRSTVQYHFFHLVLITNGIYLLFEIANLRLLQSLDDLPSFLL